MSNYYVTQITLYVKRATVTRFQSRSEIYRPKIDWGAFYSRSAVLSAVLTLAFPHPKVLHVKFSLIYLDI